METSISIESHESSCEDRIDGRFVDNRSRSFNNTSLVPPEDKTTQARKNFNSIVSAQIDEVLNFCNDIEGRISRIRNSDLPAEIMVTKASSAESSIKQGPDNLFAKLIENHPNTTIQSLSDTMVEKEAFTDGVYRHRFFDGSVYEGQWRNGAIDGFGTVKWADGNTYKGMWSDNLLHGHGEYTYSNGQKYVGEFKSDKKNGHGRYTWPDGKVYDGPWKDGLQHGEGFFTNAKGLKRKGIWHEGKRQKWLTD